MLSVQDAKQILMKHIKKMPSKPILIQEATGRIVSADVKSNIDVPSFDNSAMDGYAFRHQSKKDSFTVVKSIQAGDYSSTEVKPNEAVRIFTGAALPPGCDTVIQQELCMITDNVVSFDFTKTHKGANTRLRGSQNKSGDVILKAGSLIRPGVVGLLASVGVTRVMVYAMPSVAVIVTGNELQENGTELKAGCIYNSNEPTLHALLKQTGIYNIQSTRVKDNAELLLEKIKSYLTSYDLLILTGGISVGDYDYVRGALKEAGVNELFYKVKQKPGKPLLVGVKDNKTIFALPGNPAAVISCFYQYVRPTILTMMGYEHAFQPSSMMPIASEISVKKGLTYFLKAKRKDGKLIILPGQDSFNLLPFAEAECLLSIDEGIEYLPANSLVEVYNL